VDIFGTILWPIKWVIEAVLVAFHSVWTSVGMDPADGLTWILSILGLVIVVRSALIPLFVRQIKSQRKMLELAPQLKKIQEKYKGKRDQFSREAMSRETMELYKKTGTNPFSSCLPLLLQMPIFFSLFEVLNRAAHNGGAGVGVGAGGGAFTVRRTVAGLASSAPSDAVNVNASSPV
jgi:YidC/Oxa1 family membrane protein insertase